MFVKKLKKAISLLVIPAMAFAIAGCSTASQITYDIDETDFIVKLTNEVAFDSNMYQVKKDGIENFFNFDENIKAIMYMGSGSYADGAGIFTAPDEEAADTVLEAVTSYTEDLRSSFEDYIPEEVAKIDNAILVQRGKYVVLCITNDFENAKSIIDTYFEEHAAEANGETGDGADKKGNGAEGDGQNDGQNGGENAGANGGNDSNIGESDESLTSGYPAIAKKGKMGDYGFVITVGDTAYELYSYSQGAAEKYAKAVNKLAGKLEGKANVYDLLIPISSGITLPDELYGEIPSTNQKNALKEISGLLNGNVHVINPYERLMQHRDEYIYFRTDHHWTADGAYYAYEEACEEMGIIPIPREKHEKATFKGFLGSFYNDTKGAKELAKNPDDINAYYPISKNSTLTYTDKAGNEIDWDIIHNGDEYDPSMKYSAFIAGDNSMTVIENEDLQDGSSCVVVKESFGNALVPFLVDHYETIYVIDYRYWEGNLADFVSKKEADDVFFFNNLSMIRSDYLVGRLAEIL